MKNLKDFEINVHRKNKKMFMKALMEALTDYVLDDIAEGEYDEIEDHFDALEITLENFIEDYAEGEIDLDFQICPTKETGE